MLIAFPSSPFACEMDAAPSDALELSTASLCWGGYASPHMVAEALSLILPLLPLDSRARAACVCRAWRAATSHPALWEELSFEGCAAPIDDATLASLCARTGAALRTLRLDSDECARVTAAGMLAALRGGGCVGVRRLSAPFMSTDDVDGYNETKMLATEEVKELAAVCPALQHAACSVLFTMQDDIAAVLTALPGPLAILCEDFCADATQLAEHLRVNTTVTSLHLPADIDDVDAMQLADSLRTNTTLTSLDLSYNDIADTGAMQLADSLRTNTTLTSLDLRYNEIGNTGAMQLAECLRTNTTLLDLNLSRMNMRIGDEGAMQLAECLRVNTTLLSLDLGGNGLSAASKRALEAACPRQDVLLLDSDEEGEGEGTLPPVPGDSAL